MNKITTNLTQTICKEAIDNVLRYYQTTVIIPEFHKNNQILEREGYFLKMYDLNSLDYFEIPESIIKETEYLHVGKLEKLILNVIDDFIESEKIIYITLILTVYESDILEEGIYGIDCKNRKLLKYKLLNKKLPFTEVINYKICLSYFVDLKKSVFLQDEYGFVEGVLQVGKLMRMFESLKTSSNVKVISESGPQQVITHEMGILCTEQLFIKNQFLSDR